MIKEPTTLGEVLELLKGLPRTTEVITWHSKNVDYVILVDSQGNAQRIIKSTRKIFHLSIEVPISS
jgi:hypothetical protein